MDALGRGERLRGVISGIYSYQRVKPASEADGVQQCFNQM